MIHKLWGDAKNDKLQSQDMKQLQEICIWIIISIYRDNYVVIGGEIRFAWMLDIQAKIKTHKEQRTFCTLNLHNHLLNDRESVI